MASQYFVNVSKVPKTSENDSKPSIVKEKVMSYEEKSVGSTNFFQCEACPYMALAEDDIKFHLFTEHPDLAKKNGLADNIQISCPGCASVFDAESTLRTHLRNHHKMGIKDVKKMVKSLVQIALKNVKLKKEIASNDTPPTPQDMAEVKMPHIIEIVPEFNNTMNEQLPKGVAYISVDELNKMSTPNFEKIDPKEVIQEASINIVYANDLTTHSQYINVSNANTSNSCNAIQVSSVTPDLISSVQQCAVAADKSPPHPRDPSSHLPHSSQRIEPRLMPYPPNYKERTIREDPETAGVMCSINNCHIRLKDPNNLSYHRKCHFNGKLKCPECSTLYLTVELLHTHLWKVHAVDLELHTCEICDYKTFQRYRLLNIHMKCHGNVKNYPCSICNKTFKNTHQLSKHKLTHKKGVKAQCHICEKWFNSPERLKIHHSTVHEKLKQFKCGHCDYAAARKVELKLHLRSHTGEKPYSCDQCSYRSSDHNSLRRHKKIHSKEESYKCKYCPFTSIQSTSFTKHMISNHPNMSSKEIHSCPYCPFKSINKKKFVIHLTTHSEKEGIKMLLEMNGKSSKPSWTIPSDSSDKSDMPNLDKEQDGATNTRPTNSIVNSIPIEVYDCDSLPESVAQEYPKNYHKDTTSDTQPPTFSNQNDTVPSFSSSEYVDDNNSDCLLPTPPLPSLHFLNTSAVSMEQNHIQSDNINSLAPIHSPINTSMSNNIMSNFPIRLPLAPPPARGSITLKPVDKICLPMSKVTGPIIKPMQILPVPSSHSPINITAETDGVPRKKPKISVKSNLILKGPDQVNMFHSQQQMAFKRLEDNERFGLPPVVTFNNLIMQLQPEPALSESPNTIMSYPQDNLSDNAPTPLGSDISEDPQIFSFNPQMNVNSMSMIPQTQATDPSYIKLEATIKQNTQSPSLERMCNPILLSNQPMAREYKASPPLEDIHKNMSEIKNEVKSDAFYNMSLNSSASNPPAIDQYLIDNIIPEQYSHIDLSPVVLPGSDQQNDVIEIDDNSDENKLLSRFDMNFSLESLYLMHNDFHFLENDGINGGGSDAVNEMNRMVTEVPIINQKECLEVLPIETSQDCPTTIQGKKDPMMNKTGKQTTNKINVKNIELMKN
ncbi:RE1-silencing transcription factor-like [Aricia agestis]|uniref:RE1-silencing transcription factor-like n=1 Tax=Aricia agestis TaxID=91739 RepID=UPI001C2044F4|nr:RE1-silencing transcription factor-like [Aricia agestis]